ncbi:MAG: hypothetical protein ACK5A1_03935 [Planctomyces sp.]
MTTRRNFLDTAGRSVLAGLGGASLVFAGPQPPPASERRLRLAVLTTEWRYHSHAWHMAERFLAGYPTGGRWHQPRLQVVSAYVDQFPENDLSRQRSEEFGFPIYGSVADALRCGTDKLAVDAVLLIGEHGKYEQTEYGQTKYPRYELFRDAVDVFRRDGRSVPIFNDKHLSWNWEWAKQMYDWSRELGFALDAGSSLPETWRMPAIDLPAGADTEEVMCLAMGGMDSYDFHALEVIQCMVERRRGGETGVQWVHGLRGAGVWQALDAGNWGQGGWDERLFAACLARSQTLHQADTNSHRLPTMEQIRQWVQDPVAYRIQYRDGLRATMLLMNGLVGDFTFAARLRGRSEPLSTLFYLPPVPNVAYSAELMSRAEETLATGKASVPIERTLLTTGLVEAGVRSAGLGRRVETPHLHISYRAPAESQFANQ